MKCPNCEVIELTMADRAGVEIDYCTACRGVWLDRGELDKIIERAALRLDTSERFSKRPSPPRDDDDDDDRRKRRKDRGGFLRDIFDF